MGKEVGLTYPLWLCALFHVCHRHHTLFSSIPPLNTRDSLSVTPCARWTGVEHQRDVPCQTS